MKAIKNKFYKLVSIFLVGISAYALSSCTSPGYPKITFATLKWTGMGDGVSWEDRANWATHNYAQTSEGFLDYEINTGATVKITDSNVLARGIVLKNNSNLIIEPRGRIIINPYDPIDKPASVSNYLSVQIDNGSELTVKYGGVLNFVGTMARCFDVAGKLFNQGEIGIAGMYGHAMKVFDGGNFTNEGRFYVSGVPDMNLSVNNFAFIVDEGGNFLINNGHVIVHNSPTGISLSNSGTFIVRQNGELKVENNILNTATGVLVNEGRFITADGNASTLNNGSIHGLPFLTAAAPIMTPYLAFPAEIHLNSNNFVSFNLHQLDPELRDGELGGTYEWYTNNANNTPNFPAGAITNIDNTVSENTYWVRYVSPSTKPSTFMPVTVDIQNDANIQIWTGAAGDQQFTNPTNWLPAISPTANSHLVILNNNNVKISGLALFKSLQIRGTSNVYIMPNAYLFPRNLNNKNPFGFGDNILISPNAKMVVYPGAEINFTGTALNACRGIVNKGTLINYGEINASNSNSFCVINNFNQLDNYGVLQFASTNSLGIVNIKNFNNFADFQMDFEVHGLFNGMPGYSPATAKLGPKSINLINAIHLVDGNLEVAGKMQLSSVSLFYTGNSPIVFPPTFQNSLAPNITGIYPKNYSKIVAENSDPNTIVPQIPAIGTLWYKDGVGKPDLTQPVSIISQSGFYWAIHMPTDGTHASYFCQYFSVVSNLDAPVNTEINNCNIINIPFATQHQTLKTTALRVLNTSEALELTKPNLLQNTSGETTIEAWINRSFTGVRQNIVCYGDKSGATNKGIWLYVGAGGKLHCDFNNNAVLASTNSVPTNTWVHVAVVAKSSPAEIRLYINGVAASSIGTQVPDLTLVNKAVIGDGLLDGFGVFGGNIDNAKIWKTARTATQLQDYQTVTNDVPNTDLLVSMTFEETGVNHCTNLVNFTNAGYATGTIRKDLNGPILNLPHNISINPNAAINYTNQWQSGGTFSGAGETTITDILSNPLTGKSITQTIDILASNSNQMFVFEGQKLGDGSGLNIANVQSSFSRALKFASVCGTLQNIYLVGINNAVTTSYPKYDFNYNDAEGAKTATFRLPNTVNIHGGINGATGLVDKSIITKLSGDIGQQGIEADNASHVMYIDGANNSTVKNVLISDGFANGLNPTDRGAGIFAVNNSAGTTTKFLNCIVENNKANNQGGAVHGFNAGLNFSNCIFVNNTETTSGNGQGAGAIYTSGANSILNVSNTIFAKNTTNSAGASAIGNYNGIFSATNCTFSENVSTVKGCIFNAGAIESFSNNNLFATNTNTTGHRNIQGNISANNNLLETALPGARLQANSNNIVSTDVGFTNSTDLDGADNQYFTADDGLNIISTSAAVNKGNNSYAAGITTDLAGNNRILFSLVDIGSYESISNAPLPVRLISFTGKATENGNLLSWKTTNEKDFSHFEIERSMEAKRFEKIGKVIGSSSEIYEYLDSTPDLRVEGFFYRLSMIDLDGSSAFSKIIFIENPVEKSSVGEFYPNPSNGNEVSVNITSNAATSWSITSYDLAGRILKTENRLLNKGENQVKILLEKANNLQIFRFENGDQVKYRKVIKQ